MFPSKLIGPKNQKITLTTIFSSFFVTAADLVGDIVVAELAAVKNWDLDLSQILWRQSVLLRVAPTSSVAFVTGLWDRTRSRVELSFIRKTDERSRLAEDERRVNFSESDVVEEPSRVELLVKGSLILVLSNGNCSSVRFKLYQLMKILVDRLIQWTRRLELFLTLTAC